VIRPQAQPLGLGAPAHRRKAAASLGVEALEQWRSIIRVEVWPSRAATSIGFAPVAMANEAPVWRRFPNRNPARPTALVAGRHTGRPNAGRRITPHSGAVNTRPSVTTR
jgi:hypothetical protein